jgi:hypothetical protein
MRVRILACTALAIILLFSAVGASASLVSFTYPAGLFGRLPDIQPTYGQQGGDLSSVLSYMSDLSGFTNSRFTNHSMNDSFEAAPVMAIPDPVDFLSAIAPSYVQQHGK